MRPLQNKTPKDAAVELIERHRFLIVQRQYKCDTEQVYELAKCSAMITINELILSMEFLSIDNMDNESVMNRLNVLDEIETEIYKL